MLGPIHENLNNRPGSLWQRGEVTHPAGKNVLKIDDFAWLGKIFLASGGGGMK